MQEPTRKMLEDLLTAYRQSEITARKQKQENTDPRFNARHDEEEQKAIHFRECVEGIFFMLDGELPK